MNVGSCQGTSMCCFKDKRCISILESCGSNKFQVKQQAHLIWIKKNTKKQKQKQKYPTLNPAPPGWDN